MKFFKGVFLFQIIKAQNEPTTTAATAPTTIATTTTTIPTTEVPTTTSEMMTTEIASMKRHIDLPIEVNPSFGIVYSSYCQLVLNIKLDIDRLLQFYR